MDQSIKEQLGGIYMTNIQREILFGKDNTMLKEKDALIDNVDMDFVQNLITAVNESKLPQKTKNEMRTTLDRWQNALTLTHTIRMVF